MINMTKDDEEFLRKWLPNIDELRKGKINDLLMEINDITLEGLDENDNATDLYYKAQKVYDSIFLLN
ncbi:hypothetical protein ACOMCU_24270 [Lysinibacillus sp. UGB7]|uniref:hypothetical protein n=1 Tax=Lysinibacillus sp. UGB7 TaxID=3411039 RepID=UPI003B790601